MMVFCIVRDINIIIVFFRLNIAWDDDCLLISNFMYWRVCSWCGPTWGFLWGWNTQKGIRCKASMCLCIFDQVVLHDFHGFQWSSHILVDQIPISQRKLRSSHDSLRLTPVSKWQTSVILTPLLLCLTALQWEPQDRRSDKKLTSAGGGMSSVAPTGSNSHKEAMQTISPFRHIPHNDWTLHSRTIYNRSRPSPLC